MNNQAICCIGLPKSGTTNLVQILYNCGTEVINSEYNVFEANIKELLKKDSIDNFFFKMPHIIFNRNLIKRILSLLNKKSTNSLIIIFLTDYKKCLYKLYKLKTSNNRDNKTHINMNYDKWININSTFSKKTNIASFLEVNENFFYLIEKIKKISNIDLIIFKEKIYSNNEILEKINKNGFNLKMNPTTILNNKQNSIWYKTHKIDINILSTIYTSDSLPKDFLYYKFNLNNILLKNNRYYNFSMNDIILYDSNDNIISSNIEEIVNNLNNWFQIQINNKNFFFINNNCSDKNIMPQKDEKYPVNKKLDDLYNNLLNSDIIKPYIVQ